MGDCVGVPIDVKIKNVMDTETDLNYMYVSE